MPKNVGLSHLMKTAVTDQKRRIVLPNAEPGEVYAVREIEPGHFELSRMIPAFRKGRKRSEVKKSLQDSALTPRMTWKSLKRLTRDS